MEKIRVKEKGGAGVAISNRLVRTSVIGKLTLEQRLEGGEGVSHIDCWAPFIHSSKT